MTWFLQNGNLAISDIATCEYGDMRIQAPNADSPLMRPIFSYWNIKMEKNLNVHKGENSIKSFLNPGNNPNFPLVEIPVNLNPFLSEKVKIFAKLMTFTSLGNVKAVPAYNMIAEKAAKGELESIENIIENSSGNTVFSIAVAARLFGIKNIQSFVPNEISWNKLLMLLFFGINPIVNQEPAKPSATDPASGIYKAKKLGLKEGWLNPGQYDNEDNPKAHQKWTAKQIWEQTEGKITVFCAGLGTTGTIIGNSSYLKDQKKNLQVVGVMREAESYIPGVRTEVLLKLIGFDWRKHVDTIQQVLTADAYRKSMELSRQGIVVGPSSGFALAGLLDYLSKRKSDSSLDELRNEEGEIVCAFICPDGPIPYLDEYFKYLDDSDFPEITNEQILLNKPEKNS